MYYFVRANWWAKLVLISKFRVVNGGGWCRVEIRISCTYLKDSVVVISLSFFLMFFFRCHHSFCCCRRRCDGSSTSWLLRRKLFDLKIDWKFWRMADVRNRSTSKFRRKQVGGGDDDFFNDKWLILYYTIPLCLSTWDWSIKYGLTPYPIPYMNANTHGCVNIRSHDYWSRGGFCKYRFPHPY